jgi:probable HAF family extracellular repeat protein
MIEEPDPNDPFASSAALNISADGSAAVGEHSADGSTVRAFRWANDGTVDDLGTLSTTSDTTRALAVSGDGSVVVGSDSSDAGTEAFKWTAADGISGLGDLPGSSFFSIAHAISDDGLTIGGEGRGEEGTEATIWPTGAPLFGLGDLPGSSFRSKVFGLSSDGAIAVGQAQSADGLQAFRWTEADDMVGLGFLGGGNFSRARAISSDGLVVVGEARDSSRNILAFRWTQSSQIVSLGDLPGGLDRSIAWDVSADGATIVGGSSTDAGNAAFIWDETNGMRNLADVLTDDFGVDMTGWILFEARGVSDDGLTIVGWGFNPDGDTSAWRVTLGDSGGPSDDPVEVNLDLGGGDAPRVINLKSKGKLPVAILSTDDFDATAIDPLTVVLAGASVVVKKNGTAHASIEDVDGDGLLDLVMHFYVQDFDLTTSDTEAALTGETFDGTLIEATASVQVTQ